MGKRIKKAPRKRQGKGKGEKSRKLTSTGKLKRKRGDERLIHDYAVGYTVKQGKGGKWKRTGDRVCKIHTVCNCVQRSDPSLMRRVTNRGTGQ